MKVGRSVFSLSLFASLGMVVASSARADTDEATFEKARALSMSGQHAKAANVLEGLIAKYHDCPTSVIFSGVGEEWIKAGRREEAIQAYRRTLACLPKKGTIPSIRQDVERRLSRALAMKAHN